MAYILYHKGLIVGCYGTIDLLRLNILILCFHLIKDDKINKITYENIVEYLEYPEFNEHSFQNANLKKDLLDEDIRIQIIKFEASGSVVLEKILKHIEERFDKLKDKMHLDVRITATIPGTGPTTHTLGPAYFDCWKFVDKHNYHELSKVMYDYITSKILELIEKFEHRIKFGEIYYHNASALSYQLWSANAVNWNLPEGSKIPGSFQASSVKMQVPGVYGIVVNPKYGYDF